MKEREKKELEIIFANLFITCKCFIFPPTFFINNSGCLFSTYSPHTHNYLPFQRFSLSLLFLSVSHRWTWRKYKDGKSAPFLAFTASCRTFYNTLTILKGTSKYARKEQKAFLFIGRCAKHFECVFLDHFLWLQKLIFEQC